MSEQIKIATRKAFGQSLILLGEKDSRVVALDADLSKSTNSFNFSQKFPERFFQMGIAEANMIGVAAGMALSGYVPFACSFACFLTGRFDQIKMSIAYSGAPVRLVGTHAGVGIGEDGYSQQGLEDIALMRSLPTMQVFQPADDIETHSIMNFLINSPDPAYIRLTRQDLVRVHPENYEFKPGIFSKLRSGTDITIFTSGGPVYNSLMAAQKLEQENISVQVYNISSVKPIDNKSIQKAAQETKLLISVEDHTIMGGVGSAVSEEVSALKNSPPLVRLGVQDIFGESGTPESLYNKHGLSSEKIAESIRHAWKRFVK